MGRVERNPARPTRQPPTQRKNIILQKESFKVQPIPFIPPSLSLPVGPLPFLLRRQISSEVKTRNAPNTNRNHSSSLLFSLSGSSFFLSISLSLSGGFLLGFPFPLSFRFARVSRVHMSFCCGCACGESMVDVQFPVWPVVL